VDHRHGRSRAAAHGWKRVTAPPADVQIIYYLSHGTGFNASNIGDYYQAVTGYALVVPPYLAPTQSVVVYEEGTIVIDIVQDRNAIWRGTATTTINRELNDAKRKQSVEDLVRKADRQGPEEVSTGRGRWRVLIAGAGYIADYHLAILRELPDVEVAGACDPHPERLAALAERWSIPQTAASVEALIAAVPAEVIHVLTAAGHACRRHPAIARGPAQRACGKAAGAEHGGMRAAAGSGDRAGRPARGESQRHVPSRCSSG
jgi:hypothetical protein